MQTVDSSFTYSREFSFKNVAKSFISHLYSGDYHYFYKRLTTIEKVIQALQKYFFCRRFVIENKVTRIGKSRTVCFTASSKEEGLPQKSMRKGQRGLHYLEVPGCVIQRLSQALFFGQLCCLFGCSKNLFVYCRGLYAVNVTLSNQIVSSRLFIFLFIF